MKKVILKRKDQYKYDTIKKRVDTKGNNKRAAMQLNCTTRTSNRLIIRYNTLAKQGFVHGHLNRKPAITKEDGVKDIVLSIYRKDFSDTNFPHFSEILHRIYHIDVSKSTIKRWLEEVSILSPKARRSTKTRMKKKLKLLASTSSTDKATKEAVIALDSITSTTLHPRRPRCAYFGEMIPSFVWFGNTISHLPLAIDDATGKIVGAYFDIQETLKGYYHVFHQILTNHGIPAMFYTDKRTVFEYTRKSVFVN